MFVLQLTEKELPNQSRFNKIFSNNKYVHTIRSNHREIDIYRGQTMGTQKILLVNKISTCKAQKLNALPTQQPDNYRNPNLQSTPHLCLSPSNIKPREHDP